MKKIKILLLSFSVLVVLGGCHKDDEGLEHKIFLRTVLVYIAGDNSLSGFASDDLNEMMEGMQNVDAADNTLLVYVDNGSHPQLIRLSKNKKGKVVQEVVLAYQSRNSVDASNMREVLVTAFSKYPAKSYGIVLWSHGEGWVPVKKNNSTRWWGQDNTNCMDITELHTVLKSAPYFDFILFDACFMQSVEVAYELRDCAEFIIGSPTEIPAPGAPYQKVIPAMFTKSGNPEINIANAYFEFYADPLLYKGSLPRGWEKGDPWTAGISISIIKTELLNNLAVTTQQILPKYTGGSKTISTAGILCYDRRSTRYYYDFDGMMQSLELSSSEYAKWKKSYDETVIYWQTTDRNYSDHGLDFSMKGSTGLSTYIPQANSNIDYTKCSWYSASGWDGRVN